MSGSYLSIVLKKYRTQLLLDILFFIAMALCLPISFETNDDTMMLIISSGAYCGEPDPHLVFINYIWGIAISSLYKLYSGIEWYTLSFSVIHIISLSIITWRIFNSDMKWGFRLSFLIIVYTLEIYCISSFQFTTTAALCALSSLVLLLSANHRISRYIISILLFLVASLIRFDAAFLAFIIFSPLILFQVKDSVLVKDSVQSKNMYIILLMLFIGLPILAKQVDRAVYDSDADWKEFREYNLIRGKINDNPNILDPDKLPPSILYGDYRLLINFFPDTKVINLEVLKEIYQEICNIPYTQKLKNIELNVFKYRFFLLTFFLFSLFLLFALKNKIKYALALSLIILLFSFSYVSLDATLKIRVFITAVFSFTLVLFFAMEKMTGREKMTVKIPSALFLFCYLLLLVTNIYQWHRAIVDRNNTYYLAQKSFSEYLKTSNSYNLVSYKTTIRLEVYPPFQITDSYYDFNYLTLGWYSDIPFNKGRLATYQDLIDTKAIFIGKNNHFFLTDLKESISFHYTQDTEEHLIYEDELHYLVCLKIKK